MTKSLIIFDERYKVTSVPFSIPDFNLLSCELTMLRLKCYFESFYIQTKKKKKKKKKKYLHNFP